MKVLFISATDEAGPMKPLPLGAACVAAATKLAGHEVQLLILPSKVEQDDRIREAIQQLSPQVIGISVRNIDDQNMQSPQFLLASVSNIVAACRRASPAPIVLGGAGYSIFPESALAYLGADMGIQGEGEAAFPALLSWIEQGKQGPAPRAVYLAGKPPTAKMIGTKLDLLPLPEPSLWLDNEARSVRVPVQSRRGCPLDCAYCSTSLIEGRFVRRRSPATVVRWLAELRQRGFRELCFVDNTFNVPPAYAKQLCHEIIAADLGLDWWAIVYPKWLDSKLVDLMAKAGCTQVSLGFESGSEPVLRQLKKRFNRAEVTTIAEMFRDAGIERYGFLLLGAPGETKDSVEESLAFADGLDLDALKTTVGLRIYPHTPLARIAVAQGVISPEDDLLFPRFYLAPTVRDWLPAHIAERESQQPTASSTRRQESQSPA
jgi:radical SAM superfamily enzyme YgiQ (UPF0313 family)